MKNDVQGPHANEELIDTFLHAPERGDRLMAARKLLDQNPGNPTLRIIIEKFPDEFGEEAFARLLDPDDNDFRSLLLHATRKKWREMAAKKLLDLFPTNFNLIHVVAHAPLRGTREMAAQKLLRQNPDKNDLRIIRKYTYPHLA